MEQQNDLVKLLETDSVTDVALIKSVLEAEGVPHLFQGENIKFIDPFLGPTVLLVPMEYVDTAKDLLGPLQLKYVRMILPPK